MKPDWSQAPVWAKYLAQDVNGSWVWFALKPEPNDTHGEWMPQGRFQRAKTTPEWRETLEGMP